MTAGRGGAAVDRLGSRRAAAVVALVVAACTLSLVGVSHAARLPVQAADLTVLQLQHPCATAAVTATTSAPSGLPVTAVVVTTSGVAGCAGARVQLVLQAPSGVRSGTAVLGADGSATVTLDRAVDPAEVTAAAATLAGWAVRSTWTWTPPAPAPALSCRVVNRPTGVCSATVTAVSSWGWPSATHWQMDIAVTSDRPDVAQEWELTIDLSDGRLPFVPRGVQSNGGLVLQSGCSAMPRLVVRGTSGWGDYHRVWQGQTRAVYLQGYRTESGNLLTCG